MDEIQDLVNLEEQYHAEGFALGRSDGAKVGRAEGRQFGMEKAFEKFSELGHLNGRSALLSVNAQKDSSPKQYSRERLQRHLTKLKELTDIEHMSTENSEDGVADVDDRLREGRSKASLITKVLGKDQSNGETAAAKTKASNELEDFGGLGRKGSKS